MRRRILSHEGTNDELDKDGSIAENSMDYTRAELSRIVGYQNPYSWSIDCRCTTRKVNGIIDDYLNDNYEPLEEHQYYFLDRDGCNAFGDSALHRLLALHASPSVVRNFLTHMKEHDRRLRLLDDRSQDETRKNDEDKTKNDWRRDADESHILGPYTGMPHPPKIDAVNAKGVSALHVLVYRNSWHVDEVAKLLLQECSKLISMPMRPCGSYPLHVLIGHGITIRKQVLDVLLKADEKRKGKIVWKEDMGGNNPLSLLWKNVLRFRWARQWEEAGSGPSPRPTSPSSIAFPHKPMQASDLSWMTVIAPCQFLDFSLTLLQTAYGRTRLHWHDVCGFPRCPPLLVRLLLQQQQHPQSNCPSIHLEGSIYSKDDYGRLALHRAADSPAVKQTNVPSTLVGHITTLVQLLLLHYDNTDQLNSSQSTPAAVSDRLGRFPLHYACFNKSSRTLTGLMIACPDALRVSDPVTGLVPVQQVATRGDLRHQMDLTYEMVQACPDVVWQSSDDNHGDQNFCSKDCRPHGLPFTPVQ